ncbi:MAG: flagellar hook-length control protein FliK [Bdellovibrionales bacterium]
MKVAGLNNQAFQATAKAAGGKASQGKEKSSFENVLGEAQSADKGENSATKDSTSGSKDQSQSETPSYKQKSAAPESNVKAQQTKEPQAKASQTKSLPTKDQPAAVQSTTAQPASAEKTAVDQAGVQGEVSSEQQVSPDDASFSAEALPTGQSGPSLGTPGLTDRSMAPQVNAAYVNPLNAPAQPMKADDAANTLTRRVVWNDFLRKMNDLGVSAEDVLHAFGSLSEKDLAQPPEMSMDKIVSALGLNGQQATLAKQYFGDLIAKTKSKSFGEELSASHKQLSLSLMSQRDLQRKNLLKSIDNLGNSFFMNKTSLPEAKADTQAQMVMGEDGKPIAIPLPDAQAQNFSQMENPNMLTANGLALPGVPSGLPQANSVVDAEAPAVASVKGGELNRLSEQMQAPAAEDKKSIDQLIKNFTSRQLKSPEAAMAAAPAVAAAASAPGSVAAPAAMPAGALAAMNSIFGGGGKDKSGAGEDSGDDQGGANGINSALMPQNHLANSEGVKGEFQATMAKAPGAPQQMAVPELVQQAQLMVRDGGGDMKVTLHPDGMGEVALRVSVTDGKVNVQMITESDEAKRMIERSIGDLKTGLGNNHLQVDSIKVDTATNLGKQLEQQYHEAARQQAQQSMEQFRQEGGGQWRRSFFDTGVVNPYRTQGDAPRDSSAPASARARSTDGSRRLDLVA